MAGPDVKRGGRISREPSEAAEGFNGQLRCASLADLIQLQCSNRVRVSVSVRSDNREGHLFFDNGQIVHAVAGRLVGEDAVFEVLNWTTGTFGTSNEAWPTTPTVTSSWQQVLLVAAQRRDEQQPGFPGLSGARLVAVKPVLASVPSPPSSRMSDTAHHAARAAPIESLAPSAYFGESLFQEEMESDSVVCAARFDDSGNLLEMRGPASDLSVLAVYLRRLADLIGESAGQEGFRAFECRTGGTDLVLFVDAPGSYVIAKTTALSALRRFYRAPG
jgi:hypothetical protein